MSNRNDSNTPSAQSISTSELRSALQALADDLGHPPVTATMDEDGAYSYQTYLTRFGSWQAALRDAGLDPEAIPSESPGSGITCECPVDFCDSTFNSRTARRSHLQSHPPDAVRKALVGHLRELADYLGVPPKIEDLSNCERAEFSHETYDEWFESWGAALRLAGLPVWRHRTDEDYILALMRLAENLGRPPTPEEMDDRGQYSASGYSKRFGTWASALYLAELTEEDVSEEAWADYLEAKPTEKPPEEETNTEPRRTEDDREPKPWEQPSLDNLTENELTLISDLHAFRRQLGEPPSPDQMDQEGPHESKTYIVKFGTWARSIRLAEELASAN